MDANIEIQKHEQLVRLLTVIQRNQYFLKGNRADLNNAHSNDLNLFYTCCVEKREAIDRRLRAYYFTKLCRLTSNAYNSHQLKAA